MDVTLKPVDRHNLGKALAMRVTEEQNKFVAPNVVSMAQAAVMPEFITRLAYVDDTPVAFALYTLADEDDGEAWIHRLLVPTDKQRMGYGRATLAAVLQEMRAAKPELTRIYISFMSNNDVARRLYEGAGFMDDHRVIEGETVYRFDIPATKG